MKKKDLGQNFPELCWTKQGFNNNNLSFSVIDQQMPEYGEKHIVGYDRLPLCKCKYVCAAIYLKKMVWRNLTRLECSSFSFEYWCRY